MIFAVQVLAGDCRHWSGRSGTI